MARGRNTSVLHIRVDDKIAETYKDVAKAGGCSVSDLLRLYVEHDFLKDLGNKVCYEIREGLVFRVGDGNEKGDVDERKPGKLEASQKVGRNDPCPCGSGKKYKRCCGKYGWVT